MQTLIEAQEQFTRHWTLAQPVVAGYLTAAISDFQEAEDLLQNVAVACLRKFASYDAQRPFTSWALGVARIECLRWRSARSRVPVVLDPAQLEDAAQICEEIAPQLRAWEQALPECLKELHGRSADMIRLRYELALKPAAIAERMNMEPGAVRAALSRIRTSLRECLERSVQTRESSP